MSKADLDASSIHEGARISPLARYAQQAGLQVYFFRPKSTLYKLDAENFAGDGIKAITVDRPEREVKTLASDFAQAYGLTHVLLMGSVWITTCSSKGKIS